MICQHLLYLLSTNIIYRTTRKRKQNSSTFCCRTGSNSLQEKDPRKLGLILQEGNLHIMPFLRLLTPSSSPRIKSSQEITRLISWRVYLSGTKNILQTIACWYLFTIGLQHRLKTDSNFSFAMEKHRKENFTGNAVPPVHK